jgi:CHAD domain-containing protein
VSRSVPVSDVVGARLREQADALLHADAEIRSGNDHGVHDARVALRRLRSALATFRTVLSRDAGEQLRAELGWLSRSLGDARDRHVVRERLVALAESEAELAGPVLERILSASWTSESDTTVTDLLASQRYVDLLAALGEFVAVPPWTERAERAGGPYLRGRIAKDWDRLAGRVAVVSGAKPGAAPDEALHDIRKAAKRLRYALETAEPVWPRKAKRLRKRVRDLTELLGQRQDTVVTRAALLELAAEADAAGEPTFTHGRLDRIEELHAAELEEEFHRAWAAALARRADWP